MSFFKHNSTTHLIDYNIKTTFICTGRLKNQKLHLTHCIDIALWWRSEADGTMEPAVSLRYTCSGGVEGSWYCPFWYFSTWERKRRMKNKPGSVFNDTGCIFNNVNLQTWRCASRCRQSQTGMWKALRVKAWHRSHRPVQSAHIWINGNRDEV